VDRSHSYHKCNIQVIIKFIEDNILARFGCPRKILTDNAQSFKYAEMINCFDRYNVILKNSTPYYPQRNGLKKSSNKILIRIIKKILAYNKKAWDSNIKYALWDDKISTKKSIGTSYFQLVYGIDSIFLIHLGFPVINFYRKKLKNQMMHNELFINL